MGISKLRLVGAVIATLLVLTACGSSPGTTTKTIKIGLVTDTGGLNDKSFNHLADVGLEKAKTELHIQGDVVESHSGGDYVPNLTHFASLNYDLVIGVGFLMAEAVGTVSGTFPNIHFAIIDGSGTDAKGNDLKHTNVQSLFFKEQDAGAMVGVIAGMLEKDSKAPKNNHVISAVGGISIPPVNHYIAGYKWAAEMEDPGIKVLVGYSNDFVDPAKCQQVAKAQISAHSEVVFQVAGGCGLGALDAAKTKSVWGIGVDADQGFLGPHILTSALKGVDEAVFLSIKDAKEGHFKGGQDAVYGLEQKGVGLGKFSPKAPKGIEAKVKQIEQQIIDGKIANIPTTVK